MPDVISLLPLLPDMPRLPASDALAGGPAALNAGPNAAPASGAAAAPDFAGLLGSMALPGSAEMPAPPPPVLAGAPPAETSPAVALAGWPTGNILPEPGALLPPDLPPAVPGDAPVTAGPQASATALAALAALPRAAMQPQVAEVTEEAEAPEPAPTSPDATQDDASLRHARVVSNPAHLAALPLSGDIALAAQSGEGAPASEDDDTGPVPLREEAAADPLDGPQPDAAALTPAAALAGDVERAPVPAAYKDLSGLSTAPVTVPAPSVPAAPAAPRGPAARLVPPALPSAPESGAQDDMPAAATPAAAPRPVPATAPGSPAQLAEAAMMPDILGDPAPGPASASGDAEPSAPTPAVSSPASANAAPSLPAAPAHNAAPPLPDRGVDPRAGSGAGSAAAQIESTIAQVGDIREALRAARPAMTIQHAEFGAVSIRLEPAAPDQWRAVLASRDPGFVPAIHAALETRAIAAAADTSANFSGHSGAHQNGTQDQRYGASPNGGQGSPQPYLGQSGTRDGEAAPDHRRPSTAAAIAARGGSEAGDAAAAPPGSGGLFA